MNQMIQSDPLLTLLNWFNISKFALLEVIYHKFKYWLRSNFCRAAAFVSVLMFGCNVVHYSIFSVLITYFVIEPNEYHLLKAARFVTFLHGISASLGIVMVYLLDALFSNLKIVSYSIASSIVGLGILIIWKGKDLANIVALLFLAVGEGVRPQIKEFLEDQLRAHAQVRNTDTDLIKLRKRVWRMVPWLCSVGATFAIARFQWETTYFILSAAVLAGTFIIFLCGISYYHSKNFTGSGSSLFNFILVVKASMLKSHLSNDPPSPDLFYQNNGNETHLSPQMKIFRWMDKAAIIESANLNPEEQKSAGRLCTVTQVKESKVLLKMIPMWTSFLVFGLVASTGDTFSTEQGSEMDSTVITFYTVIFLKHISQAMLSFLFDKFLPRVPEAQNKLAKLLRIWTGMVLCTFFCAVAWRVEVRRLQQGENMSIFWLAPQYCLKGLMESCSSDGLDQFMIDELPQSLKNYASAMNIFVIEGIGSFLSIFFMQANRSLFGLSLNDSRLDKYYMRLMIMSFVNICYYYYISTIYRTISYPEVEMVERVSQFT